MRVRCFVAVLGALAIAMVVPAAAGQSGKYTAPRTPDGKPDLQGTYTFATITPGLTPEEVLMRIGHPAYVFPVGYQKLQVWNYRFAGMEGDCVVFQVSISNVTGIVSDAGPNTDPACSRGGDKSS